MPASQCWSPGACCVAVLCGIIASQYCKPPADYLSVLCGIIHRGRQSQAVASLTWENIEIIQFYFRLSKTKILKLKMLVQRAYIASHYFFKIYYSHQIYLLICHTSYVISALRMSHSSIYVFFQPLARLKSISKI